MEQTKKGVFDIQRRSATLVEVNIIIVEELQHKKMTDDMNFRINFTCYETMPRNNPAAFDIPNAQ